MINSVFRNLQKDYRVEFRSRYALNISVSFALISTLAVSLATGGIAVPARMQAVLFWIILFFSAMNGLSHAFVREEEQGTALFLRLSAPPGAIFTSKLVFNLSLFFALQAIITPLFIFFLGVEIKACAAFLLGAFAGGIAISSSATILAAITAKAGGKGPLFTVISFPVMLPVIWVASDSTAAAITRPGFAGNNIIFLFAFSAAIIALSYILFDYIWVEE